MTFALRPYQEVMIDQLRDALRRHRTVVAVAPTGSGKTALAAYMIGTAAQRGRKVWMTVHRDFLLTQTAGALDKVGVDYGFIASGFPYHPHKDVYVVSIQTLVRRYEKLQPPDLLVVDECHHAPSRTWAKIHKWASRAHHVGLTASPARLDGRGLADFYSWMVRGPSVAWLTERGFLSAYRAFAPSEPPDLSDLHTSHGDYATDELEEVMDTKTIIGGAVHNYRERANGKKAIYYGVSVAHSQHICAGFLAAGIPARHLDAGSKLDERLSAARDLAEGRILVLTNVDIFGEGYDLSAASGGDVAIEAVGLMRPTQSLVLHLQQVGRVLRPKPEPAIILDHAGNLMRHGLPDDERQWSLEGKPPKTKDESPTTYTCRECFGVYPARLLKCPYCGAGRPGKPREIEEVDGDLEEIDVVAVRASRLREQAKAETLDDLLAIAKARGYKPGWAYHVWRARNAQQGPP